MSQGDTPYLIRTIRRALEIGMKKAHYVLSRLMLATLAPFDA